MIIGVSGDEGSFSEEAGLKYIQKIGRSCSIRYLIDMEGVLAALEADAIDVGVFPFVNYNSGVVLPAFIAMGQHDFIPIDDLQLDVEQCLLGNRQLDYAEIEALYSYTPAFEQCTNFIASHQFRLVDWGDTAKAARDLKAGLIPANAGVIASAAAADKYGLTIIKRGIQDIKPNITRFIVVKKLTGR